MLEQFETLAAGWTDGALVFLLEPGSTDWLVRPAAFVYPGQNEITWVEPAYADPYGAAVPALHTRAGTVEPAPNRGLKVTDERGTETVVLPVEGDSQDFVGDALTWFFGTHLKETGRTFAEERERVRAEINSD